MATTQEAIARLRMIFETQGADAAVAEMKKLETAETSLGTSSLNLDRAFTNLERRYSETARAAADYERAMKTLNAAVAQNPALAERGAAVLATVTARYEAQIATIRQAAASHTAFGQVNQALQAQMQGLAGSTGTLGSALSVMGRGGLAVATGIGAAVLAFHSLNDAANNMAKYATDVKRFAEATGLSTAQVQGLNKEASKFGIDGERLQRSIVGFTSGFAELRQGSGGLYEAIRNVNAGLAEQMRSSEDETEALQKMITAIQTADTVWQKAQLSRAAFRKGGELLVPFLSQLDVRGLTAGRRGLSEELIADLDKGRIAVEEASREMAVAWSKHWAAAFLDTKRQWIETVRDLLNMPAAVSAQAKQSTTRASDVEALKVFEEQEQILKKRLEELEAAASAMGDESSRQFIKLTQDAGKLREMLEEVQKEKAKIAQTPVAEGAASPAAGPAGPAEPVAPPTLGQMKTDDIIAASNRYKELQSILGSLVPVAQQVEEALRQIELAMRRAPTEEYKAQIAAAKDELIAFKTVQAEMSQVAPGTYQRQVAAIKEIKAQYPGMVAQDAIRLSVLKDQLRIAQAVTGVQRMEAEQQARLNALKLEGKDLETRTLIASQERAIAEAAVNANIERQIISLNESTQLIKAQIVDMKEQANSVKMIVNTHEIMVRTQQAYNQAIRDGASLEKAAALAAATHNNLIAQRKMQIEQVVIAQQKAAWQEQLQAAEQAQRETDAAGKAFNAKMQANQMAAASDMIGQIRSLAGAGSPLGKYLALELEQGNRPDIGWDLQAGQMLQQAKASWPAYQQQQQVEDRLKSLQDQFRLGGAATPEARAQIQAQLTYEQLIKEGVRSDLAHQIANQELANAMQELAKSVDANTTALQSQLDPIYTEGRAALRIGYYGEGSGGTMRTVTGTGFAAANENAPAAGSTQATGNNLIVINNNFAAGAVMGDRRTQYQAANAYGRAIAATGK